MVLVLSVQDIEMLRKRVMPLQASVLLREQNVFAIYRFSAVKP